MIYICLAVFISVFLLCVFKLFGRFKINIPAAIIINYFAASITGFFFSEHDIDLHLITARSWLWLCIPLGFLFISIFYLMSLTVEKISISAASVANKMSVVMPVLFSVFFIGEQLDLLKFTGIILALVAVYFTTVQPKTNSTASTSLLWLPALVFIGSGCIDISLNAAKIYLFRSPVDSELFSICTFASAFGFGILLMLGSFFIKKDKAIKPGLKELAAGIILGVPNYFSIFFIIKALESGVLKSSQLFPVLNISNVALAALAGFMIFKERFTAQNVMGVIMAVISILLITL